MSIRPNWQAVALIVVFAISIRPALASPQDQIVLIHDAQRRAVYVNAGGLESSSLGPIHPSSALVVRDPRLQKLISQAAESFEVDPKLVEAVVQVESGYDARAQSPKGAQGLMQLMPATAARFGVANPFDAAENIRAGVTYLGQLLRQFNGDVPLSLAAYNAGEGAVLREGGVPAFQETRDYIRKVAALYPFAPTPATGAQRAPLVNQWIKNDLKADNAPRPVPIYRYVDEQGVNHFAQ